MNATALTTADLATSLAQTAAHVRGLRPGTAVFQATQELENTLREEFRVRRVQEHRDHGATWDEAFSLADAEQEAVTR